MVLTTIKLRSTDKMKNIIATYCFERLQTYLVVMRSFSFNGFNWILCCLDCYSKFLFCYALKRKAADDVREALQDLFLREGAPTYLHSDNGKEFKIDLMIAICQK